MPNAVFKMCPMKCINILLIFHESGRRACAVGQSVKLIFAKMAAVATISKSKFQINSPSGNGN